MSTTEMPVEATTTPSLGVHALRDLRARRKKNRLGELEWFEAAYQVYLVALFGGGGLLWLSSLVGDQKLSVVEAADVARNAPALLGLVAVLAVVLGLRSGSQGGPLALEAADVTHVMLSPVDRLQALLRPATQRIRSAVFVGVGLGGALGQLAGRRLPGTSFAWFGSGALFGFTVALLWVGAALVAHAIRLPLVIATVIAVVGFGWQGVALAKGIPGPANLYGSLALWGWRQHPVDVVALVVSLGLLVTGVALLARTSLDALARRSSLVTQLRFAVTMQDLRTVVLLRRQLTHDQTRARPWLRLPTRGRTNVIWRRGWHSLLRLPAGRLIRMVALAVGAGACQVAAYRGTTPAVLGTVVLTFVLGLEVLEPLSQEVDQPDRCDGLPIERGDLMVRHLLAPVVALIPFSAIAATTAALIESSKSNDASGAFAVAGLLAFPTLLAGAAGAAINIVRDAPDPFSGTNQQTFMPPEMAGFSTVLRTLVPLAVSAVGALSVVIVRQAVIHDGPDAAVPTAVRAMTAGLLVVAGVATWVRMRDRMRRSIRAFMSEGRAHTQQQRSSR